MYPAKEMDEWWKEVEEQYTNSKDGLKLGELELHEIQHECYDNGFKDGSFTKDAEWREKIERRIKELDIEPTEKELYTIDILKKLLIEVNDG